MQISSSKWNWKLVSAAAWVASFQRDWTFVFLICLDELKVGMLNKVLLSAHIQDLSSSSFPIFCIHWLDLQGCRELKSHQLIQSTASRIGWTNSNIKQMKNHVNRSISQQSRLSTFAKIVQMNCYFVMTMMSCWFLKFLISRKQIFSKEHGFEIVKRKSANVRDFVIFQVLKVAFIRPRLKPSYKCKNKHPMDTAFISDKKNNIKKFTAFFIWIFLNVLSSKLIPVIRRSLLCLHHVLLSQSQAFESLCRYSNIPCCAVKGLAKGVDYTVGMKLVDQVPIDSTEGSLTRLHHAWSAAYMDGKWALFDAMWAAERLAMSANVRLSQIAQAGRMDYETDMFYFNADPAKFIYSHYPFNEEWQLLNPPMSFKVNAYEEIRFFKRRFSS